MILATIRMAIPPKKHGEILESLKWMARETMFHPGCISCRIYHDLNDKDVLMFEDVWRNQDDLDRYLQSEDYRRMLLVMEMADEPPEIKFQTISSQAGLEVVEKARGCKRNQEV